MAKKQEGWEKGEGVYSRSKLPMTRETDPGNSASAKGKQLDRDVTSNAERTSGFSAKLDKGKE
jgi:hypothetical protein